QLAVRARAAGTRAAMAGVRPRGRRLRSLRPGRRRRAERGRADPRRTPVLDPVPGRHLRQLVEAGTRAEIYGRRWPRRAAVRQPLTGALYLQWPGRTDAYRHASEYTFGPDMVVEPVTADGDPAPATVWIPPGTWIDYFTGARYRGPSVRTLSVPLSQMPVLVR